MAGVATKDMFSFLAVALIKANKLIVFTIYLEWLIIRTEKVFNILKLVPQLKEWFGTQRTERILASDAVSFAIDAGTFSILSHWPSMRCMYRQFRPVTAHQRAAAFCKRAFQAPFLWLSLTDRKALYMTPSSGLRCNTYQLIDHSTSDGIIPYIQMVCVAAVDLVPWRAIWMG